MIRYATKYSLLCIKYCFVKKNHVYHLKEKQLSRSMEIGT